MEIENQDDAEVQQLKFLGSLDILSIIRPSQNQNGLKHGDFLRYRRYCAKKVKRIRKLLKFTYGKHKFQKKDILQQLKDEPKLLQILLFQIECDWSYGMDLQTNLINVKDEENRRKKFHMRKKFRQAFKGSQTLVEFCKDRVESKSFTEIQAYNNYLAGVYYQSMNLWDKALNNFISSRKIYDQLIKVSDQLQAVLFKEKLEQLDQGIRFCYQKKGGSIFDTLDKILEMWQQKSDQIQTQSVNENKPEKNIDNQKQLLVQDFIEVEYFGQKFPIKQQKVIELQETLKQIQLKLQDFKLKEKNFIVMEQKQSIKIKQQAQKINSSYYEDLFQIYIDLFNICDDIIKLLQKEKDIPTNTEGEKTIYQNTINHFMLVKLDYLLERNTLYVKQAINKFDEEDGLNNLQILSTKKAFKLKLTRPSELVKLCDNLIQAIKQIMDIERLNPSLEKFRKMDGLELLYKAIRCFFVSCMYLANLKFKEGISLIYQSENIFKLCIRKLEEIKGFTNTSEQQELVLNLTNKIKIMTVKIKIQTNQEQIKGEQQIQDKVEHLNLQNSQQNKFSSILDMLEQNIEGKKSISVSTEQLDGIPIVDMTSQLQPLSCQPIFLDILENQVKYPQVIKTSFQEKQSFWSKFNFFKRN